MPTPDHESNTDIVARIEKIPISLRSTDEQRAYNRALHAVKQGRGRELPRASTESGRDGGRGGGGRSPSSPDSDPSRARDCNPPVCPFPPSSPEGIDWTLARAVEGIQRIVVAGTDDPTVTNQDRIQALAQLRMAAGVGKEAPPPESYVLDMDSMLGGLDEADGGDDDPA